MWLICGEHGQFSNVDDTAAVEARSNWTTEPFATGALPYFEQPEAFFAAYECFLRHA